MNESCVCEDPRELFYSGVAGVFSSSPNKISFSHVERCDTCRRFSSDEEAKEALIAHLQDEDALLELSFAAPLSFHPERLVSLGAVDEKQFLVRKLLDFITAVDPESLEQYVSARRLNF